MGKISRLLGVGREKNTATQPGAQVQGPTTDARKAECPNCQGALKKVPGAKTKCPACGKLMYVRTDPRINSRIVVTFAEADTIDDEWAKLNGTWEVRRAQKQRAIDVRAHLKEKFGVEPSENDVHWSMLNQDKLLQEARHEWGDYRNTLCDMINIAWAEGNHNAAQPLITEILYLDVNGPSNADGDFDESGWDPSEPLFATLFLGHLRSIASENDRSIEEVLDQYGDRMVKQQVALRLPVSWEKARAKILREMTKS